MHKNYRRWMDVKSHINNTKPAPPHYHEGQVWWCSIGENVGVESDGKGKLFLRPVLIIKKYNSSAFFGTTLTSKSKPDRPYYFKINIAEKESVIQFSQARTWDASRLIRVMGYIKTPVFKDVKFKLARYLDLP